MWITQLINIIIQCIDRVVLCDELKCQKMCWFLVLNVSCFVKNFEQNLTIRNW